MPIDKQLALTQLDDVLAEWSIVQQHMDDWTDTAEVAERRIIARMRAIIERLAPSGGVYAAVLRNQYGNYYDEMMDLAGTVDALRAEYEADYPQSMNATQVRESLVQNMPTQERVQKFIDPRKVFVVHGRNHAARDAMFVFLRAIGLHPLEWSEIVKETGEGSPYVGTVLEVGFSIVQAVVLLMTPDDEARLRTSYQQEHDPPEETELTPQPRPNVLLEAGMALGLCPKRTVIVEFGRLRPISDIGGRHVIRMNDSPQKRHELAERLATAGCAVHREGIDWFTAGSFVAALPHQDANRTPADLSQLPAIGNSEPITFVVDDWKVWQHRGNRPSDGVVLISVWADGDVRYSCRIRLRNNVPTDKVLHHLRMECQQGTEVIHSDEDVFQQGDVTLPSGRWVTLEVNHGFHDRRLFDATETLWFTADSVGDKLCHRWLVASIKHDSVDTPE